MEISDRLYPNKFPRVGDLVVVKITNIDDGNVYVNLLEYNHEGMVPLNQLSHKKVRNIKSVVRIGSQECMEVIEVDEEKNYIDLTRKHVREDHKEICMENYTLAKKMYNYFKRWSKHCDENLVETILWNRYMPDDSNHYDGLIDDRSWLKLVPVDNLHEVEEDFQKTFDKKAEKLEVSIEMCCYSLEGAKALQEAVDKALELSTEDVPLECLYTAKSGTFGNIFVLSSITKSVDGPEILKKAVETIEKSLSQYKSRIEYNFPDGF